MQRHVQDSSTCTGSIAFTVTVVYFREPTASCTATFSCSGMLLRLHWERRNKEIIQLEFYIPIAGEAVILKRDIRATQVHPRQLESIRVPARTRLPGLPAYSSSWVFSMIAGSASHQLHHQLILHQLVHTTQPTMPAREGQPFCGMCSSQQAKSIPAQSLTPGIVHLVKWNSIKSLVQFSKAKNYL